MLRSNLMLLRQASGLEWQMIRRTGLLASDPLQLRAMLCSTVWRRRQTVFRIPAGLEPHGHPLAQLDGVSLDLDS
jgi:hypothetical protein